MEKPQKETKVSKHQGELESLERWEVNIGTHLARMFFFFSGKGILKIKLVRLGDTDFCTSASAFQMTCREFSALGRISFPSPSFSTIISFFVPQTK